MTWRRRLATLAFLCLAAAQVRAEDPALVIAQPTAAAPIFGANDIVIEYRGGDPLAQIEIYFDGSLAGRLSKPPFRIRVDAGEANAEHHVSAVATTVFGRQYEASVTTPTIEVGSQLDVQLVQLYLTVKSAGRVVGAGMKPDEFDVVDEDGTSERVVTVSNEEPQLSVVLLLDASESMEGDPLRVALDGAKTVTTLLRPGDEVQIGVFSDRLLRATQFTSEEATLDEALADVQATGGTAVLDSVYFGLNRLSTRLGRPVAILFSDGEDVSSVLQADDVRQRVRRSQATLYWVRMETAGAETPRYVTTWRGADDNARLRATLEETVRESGGSVLPIESLTEVGTALQRIFAQLREQIVLGFQPTRRRHDGSWRRIRVVGRREALEIRTRAGYVDD